MIESEPTIPIDKARFEPINIMMTERTGARNKMMELKWGSNVWRDVLEW